MAKGKKSIFFCQNCGHEESKWLGQCPMCKEWKTFVEEKVSVTRGSTAAVQLVRDEKDAKVVTLSSITTDDDERMQTGILELDRVLGGGIVPGSLVLVGGDPEEVITEESIRELYGIELGVTRVDGQKFVLAV